MGVLRSVWRSGYVVLLLIAATVDGRWISRPRRGIEGAVWISGWCRRIVAAMGVAYSMEGAPPTGGAVVSNHLSYLDIVVYSAVRPFIMVAKREVRAWPLLGWLTAQAGTVYVQRSEDVAQGAARQTHAEVNARMTEAYASGLPVLFFPEGTTTDGSVVLPFRRGLFHSILHSGVPLRTAALRLDLGECSYPATVGEHVCFVGEALLAPHLFRLLGLQGIKAQIRFGDEILSREDRFSLSQAAREQVLGLYAGLADAGSRTESGVEGGQTRYKPHNALSAEMCSPVFGGPYFLSLRRRHFRTGNTLKPNLYTRRDYDE